LDNKWQAFHPFLDEGQHVFSAMHTLKRDALRRCPVVLALLMVLVAMPGTLPLFMATLAAVDAEHRVQLGLGAEEATLVLHHDAGCAARSPQHRHCPLSRALVFFSESTGGNPDHVLHFAGGAKYLRDQSPALLPPAALAPVPAIPPLVFGLPEAVPSRVVFPDSPAPPGAMLGICTTLLLI
jgi:hypothetical protein